MQTQPSGVGLTSLEARQRVSSGLVNKSSKKGGDTYREILLRCIVTPFNALNLALAVLVLAAGSPKNALFMGVIVCNAAIGAFQELRAKRLADKLSVITDPRARVIRDGRETEIASDEIVVDDVLVLSRGSQVCCDAVIISGSCEFNESVVTGEAVPVGRGEGEEILSGSFVVSGRCLARALRVGDASFAGGLSLEAKRRVRPVSEITSGTDKIIKTVGRAVIPAGLLLFCRQHFLSGLALRPSILRTTAALVGMIPEGLVLLTSVVLAVSVLRLGRHGALVRELTSVEALARVDVLCLDKTGTLTESRLTLNTVLPLGDFTRDDISRLCASVCTAAGDSGPTADALKSGCSGQLIPSKAGLPFSSERKLSAAVLDGVGTVCVGAAEFIPGLDIAEIRRLCEPYARAGQRIITVAVSRDEPTRGALPDSFAPAGLVVLDDRIRDGSRDTLRFFEREGVEVKIISGDNPESVRAVAARAGLSNAESCVDMSLLTTDEEIRDAALSCTVFGRVSPTQKPKIINALKSAGHTVGMMGDGVNDVLALKECDCSISVASGTDAARNVSSVVLTGNDFTVIPQIVAEGRRCINNLSRSSSLFLTKTIFSAFTALFFIFLPFPYPFEPIQMTLISGLAIGLPSLLLALEPNFNRPRGGFFDAVLARSLSGALGAVFCMVSLTAFRGILGFSVSQSSTLAVILTGFNGFRHLFCVCFPFTRLRAAMFSALACAFVGALLLLPGLFSVVPLTPDMALFTAVVIPLNIAVGAAAEAFCTRLEAREKRT